LSPSTPCSPGRFSQVRKYLARTGAERDQWAKKRGGASGIARSACATMRVPRGSGGAQRIGAERRRWHRSRARPVGAKGEAERGESQGAPLARLCEFSGGNSEAEIGILKERLRDY